MARRGVIRRATDKAKGAVRFGMDRVPSMLRDSVRGDGGAGARQGDLRGAGGVAFGAAWLGHGGVLLRQGGMTILVDPVLSHRIGPRIGGRTIGPGRLSPAPLGVDGLPRVDLVLITHAHFDHLDKPTLERLAGHGTTVVTSRRTRRLIPRGFASVVELHWDGVVEVGGVRVSALRPEHWGGRTAIDVVRGCNSYLIESDDQRTLAPGDTAETGEFESVGPVDLAAFGIGAYEPSEHHHATPEQVWRMFMGMPGARLLPVHHSTFEISGEHVDEPMARLLAAAGEEAERVVRVGPGELWIAPGR
ncbi:MAG: MBL fold metallo-hydrolase [Phycisphaerales bacterium]|nr:MBL fold metallo-hydrolase [Phycisphaerales bacterium]